MRAPLYTIERIIKRTFDIAVASAGLMLLSPLLACVALLIRLDGPGPVLFFQRRYGFNQKPFHIIKFRIMTTLEDGDMVVQARRNDPATHLGGALAAEAETSTNCRNS